MEKNPTNQHEQMDLMKFFDQVSKLSQAISSKTSPLPDFDLRGMTVNCLEQAKDIQDSCAELGFDIRIVH
ncbi:hypothetical protein [Shewanella colwelliana]|uniref:hypothetical protein n=1 Tax=Shewanella colwelliana TaxID=23 RepID=UPI0022B039DE|nr:hypothetical protein [Shewanella colwelliana]MCZ4337809.1 hypothetical protein [Shewanella colwelliana]